MKDLDTVLQAALAEVEAQGLRRRAVRVDPGQGAEAMVGGERLVNFASNDYLGLARHPDVCEAASAAAARYGGGAGAARLLGGTRVPHEELEEAWAAFKRCEAAVSFSSGYAAALGAVTALVEAGDVVVVDKRVHASLVDAARLSRATLRVFRHNDVESVREILSWADGERGRAGRRRRVLIMTEAVFSMDGDTAPLVELVGLKEEFGAWLLVDEAHATGVFGEAGRGLVEALGLTDRVEVHLGTLGKAVGSAGGCVAGSRVLVDWLINRARSFIFSTAPVPAAAAAAVAGIGLVQGEEGRRRRVLLGERVRALRRIVASHAGGALAESASAIMPLILGAEVRAMDVSQGLRERGVYVPAVRFPTVPRGSARLRITASAAHTEADVGALEAALAEALGSGGAGGESK